MKLVAIAIMWICPSICVAQAPRPTDDSAIRHQLSTYSNAHAEGSAEAQLKFYAEDADSRLGTGVLTLGRAELARAFERPRDPMFTLIIDAVRFVDDTTAIVDGTYSSQNTSKGFVVYVMVKRAGTWLIRAARTRQVTAR